MELKDKIVVVTGVSKGIGLAAAKLMLAQGARVFGLGRNNGLNEQERYRFVPCDVRFPEQVKAAFEKISSETSGAIHVLVNNAGLGFFGLAEHMTNEQWDEMMQTNVNGMFYCCREVLPLMKKQQYGHIINIASTAALEGMPQVSAYCATKWAVKGFSESLFREVREERIKVTCVYPGSTKTDFFRNSPGIQPHDYMLMPEDVALSIVQAIAMPDNFHTVNLEIRPLQPKGPAKKV